MRHAQSIIAKDEQVVVAEIIHLDVLRIRVVSVLEQFTYRGWDPRDLLPAQHVHRASADAKAGHSHSPLSQGTIVPCDGFAEDVCERDGDCITDLPSLRVLAAVKCKRHWERLDASRFPEANRTVLCGVPEATIGQANAPSRESHTRTIFCHSPIHVAMTGMTFMATELQILGPSLSSATNRRGRNTFQVQRR